MSEASPPVSLGRIFSVFALIGVTSFGGGIVAYLRRSLVEKEKWLDAEEFMAALEISQTLPGLNSTNMSVIVGRKLRGAAGAVVAVLGMILPGAIIVTALGFAYVALRHDPKVALVLAGVASAAVAPPPDPPAPPASPGPLTPPAPPGTVNVVPSIVIEDESPAVAAAPGKDGAR